MDLHDCRTIFFLTLFQWNRVRKTAFSAMRKIIQQGEPSLRISAAMTRHLHSSTLSGPDEMRACCTLRHGPCTRMGGGPLFRAEQDGASLSTWTWPHRGREAHRANKVVGTVARFSEVCRYVKNKSSRKAREPALLWVWKMDEVKLGAHQSREREI